MSLNLIYKGFDYASFYNGDWSSDDSLSSLVETGANAISTTLSFAIDPQDDEIQADSRYTDLSGEATAIQEGVAAGLSVMARPQIDFLSTADYALTPYEPGEWRGYFNPGAAGSMTADAFFASYEAMILQQAQLAVANGASSLCIGSELDQITGPAYKIYWDRIINALRADDPTLKLTYAADWDDVLSPWTEAYPGVATGLAAGTGDLATQVSFASELDYIGIDCRAPISNLIDPTLTQLIDGWTVTPVNYGATAVAYDVTGDQSLISYFEGVAAAVGAPLLFTELGYENASDANTSPAGTSTGVEDDSLQASLYQAFFDAWQRSGDDSLAGVYFLNWDPNASEEGSGSVNFSPQGLPAQGVVSAEFKSGPTCVRETNSAGAPDCTGALTPARGTAGTDGTGALAGVTDSGSQTLSITAVSAGGIEENVGEVFSTEYGQMLLNSDGSYTYYANNLKALAAAPTGAPTTDVIDFTITDGDGDETNSNLTILDYRAPHAVAATGAVLAGGALRASAATGVLSGDTDPDGVALAAAAASPLGAAESGPVAGLYGTLTLEPDGSYTYVAAAPAVGSSAVGADFGAPSEDVFPILVEGGDGTNVLSSLTIAVTSNLFSGGGRTIVLSDIPDDTIYIAATAGVWDKVSGSGGTIYFTNAQASVFGGDDAINFVAGSINQAGLNGTAGKWDTVTGSSGTVFLTDARASILGGSDTILFAGGSGNQASCYDTAGAWDTVAGSGGTVYLTNSQASVIGGDDTIFLAGSSGNQASLFNTSGRWDVVNGSEGTVYLTNAQASVFGGGDNIDLVGGVGNQAGLYDTSGIWDWINGSNSALYLDSAQAVVRGGGDMITIQGGSGNQVSLYNTGAAPDTVIGSNAVIYLNSAWTSVSGGGDLVFLAGGSGNQANLDSTAGNWDTVGGSSGTLSLTSAQAVIFGGANTINLSGGAGDQASLYGTSSGNWDTLIGSNATIYLNAAQATLSGASDTIYLLGAGGSQANLRDTGSAGWDVVSGSGGTVYLTNARTSIFGGNDSIYLYGDSGNAVSLYGTNGKPDNVNGSNGALYLTNAQASVFGGDEAIYLMAGGVDQVNLFDTSGAADNVSGSNAVIHLDSASATVTGNGDVIYLAGVSAVTTNGSESFVLQAAIGQEVITGFTASDKIQFAAADFANWQALSSGHIVQVGADTVIGYGGDESLTLHNFAASSLTSSQFRFI
jgi:VCBS repeat-containing protein